ncbi:MAG: Hpt domain-containing protein [Desulfobulbaceae bacterium]|nr:Hpt domain-containing protein [Desulfobulbaceae bacterium]
MSNEKNAQDLDDQILKQMLQDFLEEALELLDQLNLVLIQLEDEPENEDSINQIFRIVHTIKGSAAFAGLEEMSGIGRKMEEIFGQVRKGELKVTPAVVDLMFEAMDALSALRESAASGAPAQVDTPEILSRLHRASGGEAVEKTAAALYEATAPSDESDELLQIYKSSYDQLAALKHLVYSSVHLDDEDTLVTLFSKQIDEIMSAERNAFWLVKNDSKVVKIAVDGRLVPENERRVLEINSSNILKRVIHDQKVVWSSTQAEAKEIMPGFESPIIVPIKSQPRAYGFFVLDPEESAEVEVYQFVGEFASMVLKNAKLHHQIDEQRKELDEMTAILFRQNNVLSTLYHVELDLMRITNPIDLCRIVTEAFVHDLETRSAAIFLRSEETGKLKGIWGSGGLEGIDTMEISIDTIAPIQQSLESGRIVSHNDSAEKLQLGSNELEGWIIMGLKGREITHGVVIAELEEDDITDSMSILSNYSGILLDNLNLQKIAGK